MNNEHITLWDEAMLAATIWILREELGVTRIFYHTHTGGSLMKGIDGRHPPRSIYTDLPRKFCFKETDERPEFLRTKIKTRAARERLANVRFFELAL